MTSSPLTPDAAAPTAPAGGWANPKRGFLVFLFAAAIGCGMAQLTPAVLTLPLKAAAIDPKNQASVLSLSIGVASLFALVAFPLFGRLSDRTTGRLGRRRPYLIVGAVLIAIGAVLQFAATSAVVLMLSAIVGFVGTAAVTVADTAIIPDQIEPLRRGPASALVGVSLPVGAVIGLFIAQLVPSSLAWEIFAPATLGVLAIVLFAVVVKDRAITAEERPPFNVVTFLSTFWTNPVKNPNFAWTWFSRLLLFFGVAAVQAYQVFFLIVKLHFDARSVGQAVFLTTLALTVAALVFAPIAARISDRVGARKPFVIAAAVIFAIGLVIASLAASFPTFVVAMVVIGIGQGVYFAVDLALVTQVLPDPDNPAKDMGIFGLASSLPSSIVPAVAPAILLIGASAANPQNYPALFLTGAVAGVVGALLILPIRRVR